jgi:hypothetical protein
MMIIALTYIMKYLKTLSYFHMAEAAQIGKQTAQFGTLYNISHKWRADLNQWVGCSRYIVKNYIMKYLKTLSYFHMAEAAQDRFTLDHLQKQWFRI